MSPETWQQFDHQSIQPKEPHDTRRQVYPRLREEPDQRRLGDRAGDALSGASGVREHFPESAHFAGPIRAQALGVPIMEARSPKMP